MEQILAFSLAGAGLYLAADWLFDRVERLRGACFAHRSLVFFALVLGLAVASFRLLDRLFR